MHTVNTFLERGILLMNESGLANEAKAAKGAARAWDRENMRTVACRLRVEEAEAFKFLTKQMNTTPHGMLSGYVRSCLKQAAQADPSVWKNLHAMAEENQRLIRENQLLRMKLEAAISRGDHAEELVKAWLTSADGR